MKRDQSPPFSKIKNKDRDFQIHRALKYISAHLNARWICAFSEIRAATGQSMFEWLHLASIGALSEAQSRQNICSEANQTFSCTASHLHQEPSNLLHLRPFKTILRIPVFLRSAHMFSLRMYRATRHGDWSFFKYCPLIACNVSILDSRKTSENASTNLSLLSQLHFRQHPHTNLGSWQGLEHQPGANLAQLLPSPIASLNNYPGSTRRNR